MMKIQKYIKKNWATLPKSTFNETEVVIFDTVQDEDGGWGHHSYEGYGVDIDGNLVCATSGGRSCSGGCGAEPVVNIAPEMQLKFDNYNPKLVDFESQSVSFSDY